MRAPTGQGTDIMWNERVDGIVGGPALGGTARRKRSRHVAVIAACAAGLLGMSVSAPASPLAGPVVGIDTITTASPCASVDSAHPFINPTASTLRTVSIPSLSRAGVSYHGAVLRPANLTTYPGLRPTVALLHGNGATECAVWWAARYLAGRGFVTITVTRPASPDGTSHGVNYALHQDAFLSAIHYLRSASNPFAARTDPARLSLVGHSLGANVVSHVQASVPHVQAIVALDNLKKYKYADPGSAPDWCQPPYGTTNTPTVPAMGLASEIVCPGDAVTGADTKKAGYNWWRAHHIPTMEVVLHGFVHNDFASGATDAKLKLVAYYLRAWIARYELRHKAETSVLLSDSVNGHPVSSILSTTFHSAVYLDCPNLAGCI
jgi:hypothetical protein